MKKHLITLCVAAALLSSCDSTEPPNNEVAEQEDIGIIFADDFSSGDFSFTQGNAKWGSKVRVSVVEKDGNPAANFTYIGSHDLSEDAFAELRFDLGTVYSELWLSYDLFIPSNYHHRDATSSDNNKMLRLWHTKYGDAEKVGVSAWQNGKGMSVAIADWAKPGQGVGPKGEKIEDFINASDLGKWMRIKVYARAATANKKGTLKLWKNNKLLMNNEGLLDNYAANEKHGYRFGYLLGWSNSGFNEDTHLWIDNVVFSKKESID